MKWKILFTSNRKKIYVALQSGFKPLLDVTFVCTKVVTLQHTRVAFIYLLLAKVSHFVVDGSFHELL